MSVGSTPSPPSPGGRELEGGGQSDLGSKTMRKSQQQIAFARRLRSEQTDAEKALWAKLKNKQLDGMRFRRQQPIGPYIVDFVAFERRLIIEIDGGQHSDEEAMRRDEDRTMWFRQRHYQVLRFWNNEVLMNLEGVRGRGTIRPWRARQ